MIKKIITSVRLTQELHEKLKKTQQEEGRSQHSLLIEAIEKYLETKETKEIKEITTYKELVELERKGNIGIIDSKECIVDIEDYEFDESDIEDYSKLESDEVAEIEEKLYNKISAKYNKLTENNKYNLYVFTNESNEKFEGSISFRITNFAIS